MLNKTILKEYTITMPNIDTSTIVNFNFNSKVGNALFNFQFFWDGDIWQGWATMPDLSVRQFGVIPNVLNWSRYSDYSLMLGFNGSSIGLTDLVNVIINIITWVK